MSQPALAPIGALRLWHERLARDPSSNRVYDTLFRAACAEAAWREETAGGFTHAAALSRQKALDLVRLLEPSHR